MPILDPSFQFFLLTENNKHEPNKSIFSFFLKYLQIASSNINRSFSTVETSFQFKQDLRACISIVNDEFKCNFSIEDDFENISIPDYYKHLYDNINIPELKSKDKESKKSIVTYLICNDQFKTKLYKPNIFYSEYHSWYLSDTPIAILCINTRKITSLDDAEEIKQILLLFKLEIDLMSAAGLTLVLSFNAISGTEEFLYQVIKDDQFSELHINIFDSEFLKNFLKFMKENYFHSNFFKGFIYLYSYFYEDDSEESLLMKIFKEIPRTEIISFSMPPNKAFKRLKFEKTDEFIYCKTGFSYEYLRIYLCNVPIYRKEMTENLELMLLDETISGICIGYISTEDFLFEKRDTQILFLDEDHQMYNSIKFNDVHLVRPDFFVKDTLYLEQMNVEMHKSIKKIKKKVERKLQNNEKLLKSYIKNTSFKKYDQIIRRVTYAYTYFMRNKIDNFSIHNTQIYTVLEACNAFFEKKGNDKDPKGVVYEIKTGEGKSCIVCLMAAILAMCNMTVHIVSSNIKLSNRDYLESFDFFKLLKLKSAVLLHKNEFQNSLNDAKSCQKDIKIIYPDKFFKYELFHNPSSMNFSVCGLDNDNNLSEKANIVFSTFVNFECFYLHIVENRPGYVEYFNKCGLLIDEADSILIDEITNGTIISREIDSNAKEILSLVYYAKTKENLTVDQTYDKLKPILLKETNEEEIKLLRKEIEKMYKEIDLVFTDKYTNGKKYIVETFRVKNNQRIKNLLKKTVKHATQIPDQIEDITLGPLKKLFNDGNDDADEDDEEEDSEEEDLNTNKYKEFKKIIPFDYDHKGIPEPNKEFTGFIQQFIALKESDKKSKNDNLSKFKSNNNNDINMLLKGISISYLYISHPIFASLYNKICGFTGTIGDKKDQQLLLKQYNLITKKVPRHAPNGRVDFPIDPCSTIDARNKSIVNEILTFHEKERPVLVIFEDFNEINDVFQMIKRKLNDNDLEINIFDGQSKSMKSNILQKAGMKGAISLGTNICGRGTDIKCSPSYPLHVIIAYYSTNTRVMEQAFGRTGRNGQIGTCKCIFNALDLNNSFLITYDNIFKYLDANTIKIFEQQKFINHYKNIRPWIFDFKIKKEDYNSYKQIQKLKPLRLSRINVNRIVAYKYKFPMFMSYNIFLRIQAQKIFSIFNCPNCKYTWRIFQRYIREMILQSWSIMINRFNLEHDDISDDINLYKDAFYSAINELKKNLDRFLPEKENLDMISTFTHICNLVLIGCEAKVLNSFKILQSGFKTWPNNPFAFGYVRLGFRPYSLLSESGLRITNGTINKQNFIKDPELSYERKMPDNSFSLLSITERIDDIFNMIFQKISSFLGGKFFLKFFLRRTLVGCEFGVCLDVKVLNEKLKKEEFLLVDKDLLLVASLYVWSMFPVLAGILIMALVYVAHLGKTIFEYIAEFPVKMTQTVSKEIVTFVINNFVPKAGEMLFEKIKGFFNKILDKQLKKMDENDRYLFENIRQLFDSGENFYDTVSEHASSFFGDFLKMPSSLNDIFGSFVNGPLIIQISILVILCLASFLRNFMNRKNSITDDSQIKTDSKQYDATFDGKKKISENKDDSSISNDDLHDKTEDSSIENEKSIDKIKKIMEKRKNDVDVDNKIDKLETDKMSDFNLYSEEFMQSKEFDYIMSNLIEKKTKKTKKKKFKNQNSEAIVFGNKYWQQYEITLCNIVHDVYKNGNLIGKKDPEHCIIQSTNKRCRMISKKMSNEFINNIELFSSIKHPVIIPFTGFISNGENSFFLFESDFADEENIWNLHVVDYCTAYGVACGLEFLSNNNIIIEFLNITNVYAKDKYPFIFCLEPDVSKPDDYDPILIAPEVRNDPKSRSSKTNVYSFGMFLYLGSIDSSICKYHGTMRNNGRDSAENFYPKLKSFINRKYKPRYSYFDDKINNMIIQCLDDNPDKRPDFSKIRQIFESYTSMDPKLSDYIDFLKKPNIE